MKTKVKILVFFLLILLVLILYLILTSESVKKIDNINNTGQQVKNEKIILLETNYKTKAKEFFVAYEKLIQDNNSTADQTAELKNQLLALKAVPAKFKELHINFVLALTKMEDYLNRKDEGGKSASQQIDNQLKADYSWLND